MTTMLELLWTAEQVAGFVSHPDRAVRRWALDRLAQRFPDHAPSALIPLLDDDHDYLILRAAELLAESGDRVRGTPPLLQRLPAAKGSRLGHLIRALARLDPGTAQTWLAERVDAERIKVTADEFPLMVEALGRAGGPEARSRLWKLLGRFTADGMTASSVVAALLEVAQPEDIRPLVQRLRSWPDSEHAWRTSLSALAVAVGAGRLANELTDARSDRLAMLLDRAERWLNQRPAFRPEAQRALAEAVRQRQSRLFTILLDEARHILESRGDDRAGWRAAWEAGERLVGYRRQAVLATLILEALTAPLGQRPDRIPTEGVLALALVCELWADRDDEGDLEQAEDRTATLLSILGTDRENILPAVSEELVALGPPLVPRLITLLEPGRMEWGAIRAAQLLARLAQRYPGSCDAAIPALIAHVTDESGDFLLEAVSEALSAIGPAAVEPIARALNDDDTRTIYLTGVLGNIPCERSAQVLLERMQLEAFADWREREAFAARLADTGSRTAIPALLALWRPGDPHLAEHLLVLHVVNGLNHPSLAEWRRLTEAEEARIEQLTRKMKTNLQTTSDLIGAIRSALQPTLVPPSAGTPRPAPVELPPVKKRKRGRRSR